MPNIKDRILGFLKKLYLVSIKTIPAVMNPKNAAKLSDIPRVIVVITYRKKAIKSFLLCNNCAITTQANRASRAQPRSR